MRGRDTRRLLSASSQVEVSKEHLPVKFGNQHAYCHIAQDTQNPIAAVLTPMSNIRVCHALGSIPLASNTQLRSGGHHSAFFHTPVSSSKVDGLAIPNLRSPKSES